MRAWHLLAISLAVNVDVMTGYSNNSCNVNEYKYLDICCPRCQPGYRVQEHCTQNSGTICGPCVNDTYQSDFNAGKECVKCTICEEGATEIKPCSSTRDTVCNCTEGHYCPNITKDGCRKCLKHRVCSASEREVRKGTSSTDTECQPCANGICSPEGNTNIGNTAENSRSQTIIIISSVFVAFLICCVLAICLFYFCILPKLESCIYTYISVGSLW